MPYGLSRGDATLQAALRRIAGEELGAMQRSLGAGAGAMSDAAVHDLRKRVKKLRGLLRLLRSGFPAYRAEMAALRRIGAVHSAARDGTVRHATLTRLFTAAEATGLAPLHADLSRAGVAPTPADLARLAAEIAALKRRAARWRLNGKDTKLLFTGLKATQKAARRAMQAALAAPDDPDAMHVWRKRVKDGWYQSRLLAPVWPEVMGPWTAAWGALAELLGDHRDMTALGACVAAGGGTGVSPDLRADVAARAARAAAALRAQALPLGQRLLAGRAAPQARLWVGWWQAWRDGGGQAATSAPASARSISAIVSDTP